MKIMKPQRQRACSFTLIELLAVVAVIAILAGLVLGAAGAVRQRAARSQAKSEISTIEAGLARYKVELDGYPVPTNPIATTSNGYAETPGSYVSAGQTLFNSLWGASNYATVSGSRQYLNVKSSMVNTNGTNYFVDPWGYAYGYAWNGSASLYGTAVPDVWSTGGQSGIQGQTNRAKWICSWD